MKILVLLAVAALFLYDTCVTNKDSTKPVTIAVPEEKSIAIPAIDFDSSIKPILVKRCSPCHFPGGKMYEKLPFDQGATLLKPEVKPGILKRIKDENENSLIKNFIEQGTKE